MASVKINVEGEQILKDSLFCFSLLVSLFSNGANWLFEIFRKWLHGCSYRLNNIARKVPTGPAGFLYGSLVCCKRIPLGDNYLQVISQLHCQTCFQLLYLSEFQQKSLVCLTIIYPKIIISYKF